jgi:phosphoribosylformylglycinamidine synthase
MAACGEPGEDAALHAAVHAIGEELCPALGIAIPVGKDSLSMRTAWQDDGIAKSVVAPVSLIASAFAPVRDVRCTVTPQLQRDAGPTALLLVDLAAGRLRLGGSVLAQVYGELGTEPADFDAPERCVAMAAALAELRASDRLLAYHDRSDGGVAVTLLEMAFAGHMGLEIDLPVAAGEHGLAALFAEELGVVLQVRESELAAVEAVFAAHGLAGAVTRIGRPLETSRIVLRAGEVCIEEDWSTLKREWSETSYRMRALRDDPECAREEFALATRFDAPALQVALSFDAEQDVAAPFVARGARPAVAILREQGVNSQSEMAAVFDRAGFEAHDVHMTDLIAGRRALTEFRGLVACGGFSYGDVLGAGEGWAKSILFNARLRDMFEDYFARSDRFALGVCNGCQMMAQLAPIVPGAEHWPRFVRNRVEQFEARATLVEVQDSPSILLAGMRGSMLPIAVSHGEGRAEFRDVMQAARCESSGTVGLRYVSAAGAIAVDYPSNPNGSPNGLAALCNLDGRVTIAMPHPERVFRNVQMSWRPAAAPEYSGWMRLFRNARVWVG